jgi:Family of unknown function (DUF6152)
MQQEAAVTTKSTAFLILFVAMVSSAGALFAHHGTGISYDLEHKPIVLKGVITEFRWKNPHVSVFMDVKDPDGKVVNWALEGNSIANYARAGFNHNTLKTGQEVTALVYVSKVPNNPAGVIAKVTTADGKEVLRFQRDEPGGRGVE